MGTFLKRLPRASPRGFAAPVAVCDRGCWASTAIVLACVGRGVGWSKPRPRRMLFAQPSTDLRPLAMVVLPFARRLRWRAGSRSCGRGGRRSRRALRLFLAGVERQEQDHCRGECGESAGGVHVGVFMGRRPERRGHVEKLLAGGSAALDRRLGCDELGASAPPGASSHAPWERPCPCPSACHSPSYTCPGRHLCPSCRRNLSPCRLAEARRNSWTRADP